MDERRAERRSSRRGSAATALALALALSLGAAPTASADHHGLNPPWPQALPGQTGFPYVEPVPVKHCRKAGLACVDSLIRRLREQWRPLNRACDHRAVMTFSYLRINEALRDELARRPSIFGSKHWFERVLATFSNRYFESFDRYERGKSVPEAWQIAYDAMAAGDLTGGQEILLFSNAHVQRDLPFAYVESGLVGKDGVSRKHDHDAFNEINNRILDPVGDELARRYDPTFTSFDASPVPLDELSSQEVVKSWRETSWRNAERLAAARTPAERRAVGDSIETLAQGWATMIAGVEAPGLRASRDEYCRAQQESGAAGPISRR